MIADHRQAAKKAPDPSASQRVTYVSSRVLVNQRWPPISFRFVFFFCFSPLLGPASSSYHQCWWRSGFAFPGQADHPGFLSPCSGWGRAISFCGSWTLPLTSTGPPWDNSSLFVAAAAAASLLSRCFLRFVREEHSGSVCRRTFVRMVFYFWVFFRCRASVFWVLSSL